MDYKAQLTPYLVIWICALALIVWRSTRTSGAGLMLAYCFQMFMMYWMGALTHALPWADLPSDDLVYLGLQQATYAVIAFAVGSVVFGPMINGQKYQSFAEDRFVSDPRLPRAYIVYGICSYFVLAPTLGRVAGFNAISAVGSQLVVVGCCLSCWKAWNTGGQKALLRALAPALIIPCVTIVVQGFLGFGVMALSTIMVFCAQFFRPRWILLVGFAVSCFFGLSVYTTYMKGREALRDTVWDEDSHLSDKVKKLSETAKSFEWFDPWNDEQLGLVDSRLNQVTLIGAAVDYLTHNDAYAKGDTLVEALIAMVPRLIWPNKPVEAGSSGMVSRFTGIEFAAGTSVGVGPVMELYANFGTPAVIIGFLVLGTFIQVLDSMAGYGLASGDWHAFATPCLVGISFLNVAGSFVEISMGALASLLLAKFVNALLKGMKSRMSDAPDDAVELAGTA